MNSRTLAAGLLLAGLAAPLSAQSVPDDVRCFLLSNYFARANTDAKGKEIAAQSVFFFAGRVEGRSTAEAITTAVRAQLGTIDAKTATTEMSACAGRMQQGLQVLQRATVAAAPKK
jgi:hypothetical protein